jgi:hypothetical protein
MIHSDQDAPGLSGHRPNHLLADLQHLHQMPPAGHQASPAAPQPPMWVRTCTNPACPYPTRQIRAWLHPWLDSMCLCGSRTTLERRPS